MTRLISRKFRAICFYVCTWIIASLGFAILSQYGFAHTLDLFFILFVLQLSLFVGLSHGVYDVVILQDEMGGRNAFIALLVRSLFFGACITLNMILCVLIWNLRQGSELISENGIREVFVIFRNPEYQMLAAYFFALGHLITFVRSVHKKFGSRVFVNSLLGKYQEPTEEDLIFMFVDLRNSTTIAEELGHKMYSNFMKDYYHLLSNCCAENRGEIYQIAGDGAFLIWKTTSCKKRARPLDCFYDFKECLIRTRPRFMKRYGMYPTFKAGAHCGKVIATEVGNFGSEMAYHGDVLNTTSRLQHLCTPLKQEFLISETLKNALPASIAEYFSLKNEGFYELKGKKQEILIFSVHNP